MFIDSRFYDGDPRFTLQYGSLNTATTFDSWLIQPHQEYPYYCYFNQAANAGLVDGVTLTGQTSGAVIKVGHVVLTQGALNSGGMGVLFYQIVSGVIATGENLRVSSTTYCVASSKQLDCPLTPVRSIYITVETNTIRYCIGGSTPTNSAATPASFGIPLTANQNIVLASGNNISSFSMINAVSNSLAVVDVTFNF
jgi:hypothetical protein